jgi:predicted nucleic-acid-binding protein
VETTLLELVTTLGELTEDDREVVASVVELLRSGRVRLIGNFRGQKIAVA